MKKDKLKRRIALLLSLTLMLSSVPFAMAEETDTENAEVKQEEKVLTDAEIVSLDKQSLDIGFILCVSRDLKLPTEGENGSEISWKSSHPDIISDDGKYTVPEKITEVKLTATLKKGSVTDKKVFTLNVNDRTMYDVVKDYADTMIKYGRDNHGFTAEEHAMSAKTYDSGSSYGTGPMDTPMTKTAGRSITPKGGSGLFFSMIDRETLKYPAYYVTDWPRTEYNSDERGSGCNTAFEYWLYNILYELTLLTGDESYEKIADDNLYFFITYCQEPTAGPLAWGLHTIYDPVLASVNTTNQYATTLKEQDTWTNYTEPGFGDKEAMQTPFFINKLYELNARAADNHMMSWWEATVANQKDFVFGRHTDWAGSGNGLGGYLSMINPMAYAYAWGYHYSGDYEYLRALDSFMDMVERVSAMNENYLFVQDLRITTNRSRQVWTSNQLMACTAIMEIKPLLPPEMQERMQRYIDNVIDKYPMYDEERGFAGMNMLRDGQPTMYGAFKDYLVQFWKAAQGTEAADRIGEWGLDWMNKNEFYSLNDKLELVDYFPRVVAQEMKVHMDVYKMTGDEKFLDRALEYADFCIYDFWEMESLLPSMSHAQKKYYESSWGSVQCVDNIWQVYFMDLERKTGVNPKEEAWEKAGYAPKTMQGLLTDTEFLESTKRSIIGGTANE